MKTHTIFVALASNHTNLEITSFLKVTRWTKGMTGSSMQTPQWCIQSLHCMWGLGGSWAMRAMLFQTSSFSANTYIEILEMIDNLWIKRMILHVPTRLYPLTRTSQHGPCEPGMAGQEFLLSYHPTPYQIDAFSSLDLNPLDYYV